MSTLAGAANNASLLLRTGTLEVTPGQLMTVDLDVMYDDGVEVIFNPRQQHWGAIQLQEYVAEEPRWQQGQWQIIYTLKLIAPKPGEYQFPALQIHFYRDADHWILETESEVFVVQSAFAGKPYLHGLLPLPETGVTQPSSYGSFLLKLFILLSALLVAVYCWHKRQSPVLAVAPDLMSAEQLALRAESSGIMDWDALRLWLMTKTGSDPLGKLTSRDTLLLQYQQLRFDERSGTREFSEFCRQCQARWG